MIKRIRSIFETFRNAFFEYLTYTSLEDMRFKMDRYVPLVVNDNLRKLQRTIIPIPKSYLAAVYEDLKEEYYNLSGNKDYEKMKERMSQFDSFVLRVERLKACGMVLTLKPDSKDVLDLLKRSGIRCTHDNAIEKINAEIKALKSRIAQMQEVAKVEQQKNGDKDTKVTTSDYIDIISRLRKEGYGATMQMPVLEYIRAIKLHKDEIDRNNKELERIKNKR